MEKSVLVVEDEADIREAMCEAVADAGFSVTTAENGEVGLKKATTDHPDLILLDLVMPVMDGHEMLEKLRLDSWGKNVKVIVLTSMDDVHNVANAHEGDITDYIIKAHSSLDDIVAKIKINIFTG